MPRCSHEPKTMSSQGDKPDSKEGFLRAFVQRFWRVDDDGGGDVGMAWRNGRKRRDHRNMVANILEVGRVYMLYFMMLCRGRGMV